MTHDGQLEWEVNGSKSYILVKRSTSVSNLWSNDMETQEYRVRQSIYSRRRCTVRQIEE